MIIAAHSVAACFAIVENGACLPLQPVRPDLMMKIMI
jgi:hypothetical protein